MGQSNSFGAGTGIGAGRSLSGMPGLGSGGMVGSVGSGLNLSSGTSPLNGALGGAAGLGRIGGGGVGGAGSFGGMGGPPASYNPAGSNPAGYNPSGEILAMINKAQNLGLPQNQPLGMTGSLPPNLVQAGMPPGAGGGGLGLGGMVGGAPDLGAPPLVGGMGQMQSPSFDISDFPSLGQRVGAAPSACGHHFRAGPGGLGPGALPTQAQNPEFAIQNEDFPALPGASPTGASMGGGGGCEVGGVGGIGAMGMPGIGGSHPSVEALLGGGVGKDADGSCGLRGAVSSAAGSGLGGLSGGSGSVAPGDRYGLMGLLSVIRMTDQDLNTLALGTDLTTLGLNLNSTECLYATFASPWADAPAQRDPEFSLPPCYYMQPPALKTGHFSKFQLETLFYIFYNMPRDTLQAYAATELYNRDWRYHKDLKLWFTKANRQGAAETQKGQYIYFDINEWKKKMFHGAAGGAAGGGGGGVDGEGSAGIDDL
jgi:CCR4-NOT transcription complex subunit 2